jgi:serine/threonine protein kinase
VLVAQRYRLEESIGRGGMGQVWRAVDQVLERKVAVKLLHPGLADEICVERFRLEARAAALVSHPNVVAVYDFGTHDDGLFLVMELVCGRSLARELADCGVMDPEFAMRIASQAAAGLSAAHREGVVHRDVKPGNLLLGTDCTVKIADFGIARLLAGAAMAITATGEIAGTSHYLAPERAVGGPGGPESDVYSLGCVLYQLVTGHPPFHGDAPAAIAYQHVDTEPDPPRSLRPELTAGFEAFLLRMLAKDPRDRPTAPEVAEWTPTATQPVVRPASRHRRLMLSGGAAAATTAAMVLGMLLLPGDGDATPSTPDPSPPPTTPASTPRAPKTSTPVEPTVRPTTPPTTRTRTELTSTERTTRDGNADDELSKDGAKGRGKGGSKDRGKHGG